MGQALHREPPLWDPGGADETTQSLHCLQTGPAWAALSTHALQGSHQVSVPGDGGGGSAEASNTLENPLRQRKLNQQGCMKSLG